MILRYSEKLLHDNKMEILFCFHYLIGFKLDFVRQTDFLIAIAINTN